MADVLRDEIIDLLAEPPMRIEVHPYGAVPLLPATPTEPTTSDSAESAARREQVHRSLTKVLCEATISPLNGQGSRE